jgi:mannose-6-phosphate isomerase-like protein (cupin superfamily)
MNGPGFRIFRPGERAPEPLDRGRGLTHPFVDAACGTDKLDVHLNRLKPGGVPGRVHRHTRSDNVYIVVRGEGRLTVDDDTHTIRAEDVVYIAAGVAHALANAGAEELVLYEIYAPAGPAFDFVVVGDER